MQGFILSPAVEEIYLGAAPQPLQRRNDLFFCVTLSGHGNLLTRPFTRTKLPQITPASSGSVSGFGSRHSLPYSGGMARCVSDTEAKEQSSRAFRPSTHADILREVFNPPRRGMTARVLAIKGSQSAAAALTEEIGTYERT